MTCRHLGEFRPLSQPVLARIWFWLHPRQARELLRARWTQYADELETLEEMNRALAREPLCDS